MNSEPVLFRVSEAAELLRMSRAQAYVLVAKGIIPSIRIGSMIRIPADAFREMVAQARREAQIEASERSAL